MENCTFLILIQFLFLFFSPCARTLTFFPLFTGKKKMFFFLPLFQFRKEDFFLLSAAVYTDVNFHHRHYFINADFILLSSFYNFSYVFAVVSLILLLLNCISFGCVTCTVYRVYVYKFCSLFISCWLLAVCGI